MENLGQGWSWRETPGGFGMPMGLLSIRTQSWALPSEFLTVPNKFPGGMAAAGPGTTLRNYGPRPVASHSSRQSQLLGSAWPGCTLQIRKGIVRPQLHTLRETLLICGWVTATTPRATGWKRSIWPTQCVTQRQQQPRSVFAPHAQAREPPCKPRKGRSFPLAVSSMCPFQLT